jgi:hypothetical protein
VIPYVPPVARALGFTAPPVSFLLIVAGFVVAYLALAELGKWWFYRTLRTGPVRVAAPTSPHRRHVRKVASRWVALSPRPALPAVSSARDPSASSGAARTTGPSA